MRTSRGRELQAKLKEIRASLLDEDLVALLHVIADELYLRWEPD